MATPTRKPNEGEVRKMADARIKELLKSGSELKDEDVLATFSEWVLPDRHLNLIRERVERWRDVAKRRAGRKAGA
jgi:hypothetical protein